MTKKKEFEVGPYNSQKRHKSNKYKWNMIFAVNDVFLH